MKYKGQGLETSDRNSEVSSFYSGDIVVHIEHGIARFHGLIAIETLGIAHDYLELHYHGNDKLYLPVENIELLSRYRSSHSQVLLDRLGGATWQARKSKVKKRILDLAKQLIQVAAERHMLKTKSVTIPDGLYDDFTARFPHEETEDQMNAINSVLKDLASGYPMDRLVCGDVGFGKTEVALRATFLIAMAGYQIAVIVPTTLLARQHYKTFIDRFHGLPLTITQASRLVGGKALSQAREGAKDGSIDIIVGTHTILEKYFYFKRLGLIVIDEEQRFGVKQKERLKELRSGVHVLTLSATPIPRTLQLALTGVRDLSLIKTPPIDRIAVKTVVIPFDSFVVRDALLRENSRGGQSFYICPRLCDLRGREAFLAEHVPKLKVALAHGTMHRGELEDVMNAFYEGRYDILLSTPIVESGLDIPTANTMIVHRSDMFGLSQLYQMRGRIGRSKVPSYAFMTLTPDKVLTVSADRRLKIFQSLDTLGANFEVANHDLDIRGSGNLLGKEQSGQVHEVGYELYQKMLEEAISELKEGKDISDPWSPKIVVRTAILIPESYVPDLTLRMTLYHQLANLNCAEKINLFADELVNRFGTLPPEVDHLLKIMLIKSLCKKANIEKLDVGEKGIVIHFRNQEFPNPFLLVQWIKKQENLAKIRPDQSLILKRNYSTPEKQLRGTEEIVTQLAEMNA